MRQVRPPPRCPQPPWTLVSKFCLCLQAPPPCPSHHGKEQVEGGHGNAESRWTSLPGPPVDSPLCKDSFADGESDDVMIK